MFIFMCAQFTKHSQFTKVKETFLQRRRPSGKTSLQSIESVVGERFLPPRCLAQARTKGALLLVDTDAANSSSETSRSANPQAEKFGFTLSGGIVPLGDKSRLTGYAN